MIAKPTKAQQKQGIERSSRLSIAPMMDWTDRHCRYFHRVLTKRTLLYTEMVTAAAINHGNATRLLKFHTAEHPVALQLGGSDPQALADATRTGVSFGYDEVNLNVGCPSDRVQSGAFGAVLMKSPELVRDCVSAMMDAAGPVRVTVKCRIGVDDQNPADVLPTFLQTVAESGVTHFTIHARKAWLKGLSPKENRDIPPLDYDLVGRMKSVFEHLTISINGGVVGLKQAQSHLDAGLDGVMIGRAAYHNPALLLDADRQIFGVRDAPATAESAVLAMCAYVEAERQAGTPLNAITRHMLGIFAGRPGARQWRRYLSENTHKPGAGPEVLEDALALVTDRAA